MGWNLSVEQLQPLRAGEKALFLMLLAAKRDCVSVTDASQLIGWTVQNTSHVLNSLHERQLLVKRKYGNFRLYSVSPSIVGEGTA